MRKVIIVQGTYGYRPEGSKHVTPKSRSDGPIELPDVEAERILKLGVAIAAQEEDAETVQKAVATGTGGQTTDGAGDDTPDDGSGAGSAGDDQEKPDYNADMKVDQLRGLMKQFSIPFKAGMTKTDMVTALDAYFADAAADEEHPPDIQAEGPVA